MMKIIKYKKGSKGYKKVRSRIINCQKLYFENMSSSTHEPQNLLEALFIRISKCVAAQYGYSPISGMCDYRWLLHMNSNEDIDLRRLHTYTELKESIWLIYDSKIKLLNLKAYQEGKCQNIQSQNSTIKKINQERKSEMK